MHGAATVVLRNYLPQSEVSAPSLAQAAVFALCHSASWDNNLINRVYWVHAQQVSKTAPSGEYLPTGSFMVRGKKNYLAPARLEMGLGLLFQVDEASAARHRAERRRRDLTEQQWSEVLEKGCVAEGAAPLPAEECEDLEEAAAAAFTIEVMDTVQRSARKARPQVKVHAEARPQARGGKKTLKGTTKKSRAAAEERAALEALEAEPPAKKAKEPSRSERRQLKKQKKRGPQDSEEQK